MDDDTRIEIERENDVETREPSRSRRKGSSVGKKLLGIILLVALLVGGYMLFSSSSAAFVVNGEKFSNARFTDMVNRDVSLYRAQYEAENQALMNSEDGARLRAEVRQYLADSIVREMLILQDAARLGIVATEAEVQEFFENQKAEFESESQFREQLSLAQISERDYREEIRKSIIIEKYAAQVFPQEQYVVTDDEVLEIYLEIAGEDAEEMDEEIAEYIRAELQAQILAPLVEEHVSRLIAAADIKINVDGVTLTVGNTMGGTQIEQPELSEEPVELLPEEDVESELSEEEAILEEDSEEEM